jgi:uncharacterized protein
MSDSRARLKVKVTANSHRPGLVGVLDNVVHLKVSAPPADGRANNELCRSLAEFLRIPASLVSVRFGHSARVKTVEVQGIDEEAVFAILRQHLQHARE